MAVDVKKDQSLSGKNREPNKRDRISDALMNPCIVYGVETFGQSLSRHALRASKFLRHVVMMV